MHIQTYQTIRTKRAEPEVCRTWLAEAIGLSRKCLNAATATERNDPRPGDESLKCKIIAILSEFACYGYRRTTAELKRRGEIVNEKKVARVMGVYGLAQKPKKRSAKTTDSKHALPTFPNLVKDIIPDHPFHIFASDITYVRLPEGFCYVALVIDIFTRKVVGWAVATHMETSLVMEALRKALVLGTPEYHHSDRGSQYCSHEYTETLQALGTQISMADVGMSVDNPYAESMNKTLKQEEVYLKEYRTVDDARHSIGTFIEDVYNSRRLHSSLGYMPPEEFEREWYAKHTDVDSNVNIDVGEERVLTTPSRSVSLTA